MNRPIVILWSIFLVVSGISCRAQHLQKDQDQFRYALLDLYTDQIMDNLIRAQGRLPLVQLDYSDITGTITQDVSGSLDGVRTNASGAITRMLTLGVKGGKSIQLTVTANPVVDDPGLYDAYSEFASRPDRLMVTCNEPEAGTAHIVRQCGEQYYWVPIKYKDEFFKLALRTTVKRSEPVSQPDTFDYKVVGKTGEAKETGKDLEGKWTQYEFLIQFQNEVPNDSGFFLLAVKGQVYRFSLRKIASEGIEQEKTRVLFLRYVRGENVAAGHINLSPDELAAELADKVVTIKFDHLRPIVPQPTSVGPALRRETQLFRLDQMKRN